MTISDYLIIFATLLGPLLAVQTQKWLEAARERRRRKEHVFQILMATRAARLSPEHVGALNQLDLAFYGKRTLGFSRRTRSEQQVLDSWKEYLDHLCAKVDPNDNGQFAVWCTHNDELFTNIDLLPPNRSTRYVESRRAPVGLRRLSLETDTTHA